jgi:hypothetical protein
MRLNEENARNRCVISQLEEVSWKPVYRNEKYRFRYEFTTSVELIDNL